MKKEDIKAILLKINSGTATPEEEQIALYWLHYFRRTDIPLLTEKELNEESDAIYNALISSKPAKVKKLWPRIAAAASILFFLSIGGYWAYNQAFKQPDLAYQARNIKPGGNKAYLILAGGQRVDLTAVGNGQIARQSGVTITKSANGQLVYQIAKTTDQSALQYNTIETPKGGQYQVILPDGSHVWLNAATSLTYPTRFVNNERKVKLTGEAYFEVSHDKTSPFKVDTKGQQVEVLGTHFNVSAYLDEGTTRTTLLEGSVQVSSGLPGIKIKPGQQAVFNGQQIKVLAADTEEAVAWREGMFRFSHESLESVMRKVSRWYNVEIIYENDEVRKLSCKGISNRFSNVSEILRMMELTNQVHFKVEKNQIIVTK